MVLMCIMNVYQYMDPKVKEFWVPVTVYANAQVLFLSRLGRSLILDEEDA